MQNILDQIYADVQPLYGTGRVADYIPALGQVPPRQFGMAVAVWAPELDAKGNSALGAFALERLVHLWKM
jgi:glutaminase